MLRVYCCVGAVMTALLAVGACSEPSVSSGSRASGSSYAVSLIDLLTSGDRYEREYVRVMGYLSAEARRLYLTQEHAVYGDELSAVTVANDASQDGEVLSEQCPGEGFATVIGRLQREGGRRVLRDVQSITMAGRGLDQPPVLCWLRSPEAIQ